MKRFSFTDVSKTPGQVLDEAMKGPVTLTKHGREKLVIVSAEQFRALVARGSETKGYSLHDPKAPYAEELREAVDAALEELDAE